jgi:hypothetical protein
MWASPPATGPPPPPSSRLLRSTSAQHAAEVALATAPPPLAAWPCLQQPRTLALAARGAPPRAQVARRLRDGMGSVVDLDLGRREEVRKRGVVNADRGGREGGCGRRGIHRKHQAFKGQAAAGASSALRSASIVRQIGSE